MKESHKIYILLHYIGFIFLICCSHKNISPNHKVVIPTHGPTDRGQCRNFPNCEVHFGEHPQYNLQNDLAGTLLILVQRRGGPLASLGVKAQIQTCWMKPSDLFSTGQSVSLISTGLALFYSVERLLLSS